MAALTGYSGTVKVGATDYDIGKWSIKFTADTVDERRPSYGLWAKKNVIMKKAEGSFEYEVRDAADTKYYFPDVGASVTLALVQADAKILDGPAMITDVDVKNDPGAHEMLVVSFKNSGTWTHTTPSTP